MEQQEKTRIDSPVEIWSEELLAGAASCWRRVSTWPAAKGCCWLKDDRRRSSIETTETKLVSGLVGLEEEPPAFPVGT